MTKQTSAAPSYLNMNGVARKLGVTRQRIGELRDAGRLPQPSTYVNGRALWDEADIYKFGVERQAAAKDAETKAAKKTTKKVAKKKSPSR